MSTERVKILELTTFTPLHCVNCNNKTLQFRSKLYFRIHENSYCIMTTPMHQGMRVHAQCTRHETNSLAVGGRECVKPPLIHSVEASQPPAASRLAIGSVRCVSVFPGLVTKRTSINQWTQTKTPPTSNFFQVACMVCAVVASTNQNETNCDGSGAARGDGDSDTTKTGSVLWWWNPRAEVIHAMIRDIVSPSGNTPRQAGKEITHK